MKSPTTEENDPQAIRSDIDQTRQRMDDTMDAIGERLHGRHLVDEVLGFFRGSADDQGRSRTDRLKESAKGAIHSVTDSIAANPMPAVLIGAGLLWMLASSRRKHRHEEEERTSGYYGSDSDYEEPPVPGLEEGEARPQDAMQGYASTEGGPGAEAGAGSGVGQKLAHVKEKVSEKSSQVMGQARNKMHQVAAKSRELRQRGGEVVRRTRDQVVRQADEHPLELGIACLAAGIVAGLAVPSPGVIRRRAGPPMERLRGRAREAGRELVNRGRRAAQDLVHRSPGQAGAESKEDSPSHSPENSGQGNAPGMSQPQGVAGTSRPGDAPSPTPNPSGLGAPSQSGLNPPTEGS